MESAVKALWEDVNNSPHKYISVRTDTIVICAMKLACKRFGKKWGGTTIDEVKPIFAELIDKSNDEIMIIITNELF